MPSSVLSTKREIAISAPVLPALTTTSARPSLIRLTAIRIDDSRLLRSAVAGAIVHLDHFFGVNDLDAL